MVFVMLWFFVMLSILFLICMLSAFIRLDLFANRLRYEIDNTENIFKLNVGKSYNSLRWWEFWNWNFNDMIVYDD